MRWMKSSRNIAKRASPRRLTLALPLLFVAAVANSQETTLHTQTTVVLVPALVKTADGGIVYGLDAKDFTIEDNGIEQPARMDETPDSQMVSIVVTIQIGR